MLQSKSVVAYVLSTVKFDMVGTIYQAPMNVRTSGVFVYSLWQNDPWVLEFLIDVC